MLFAATHAVDNGRPGRRAGDSLPFRAKCVVPLLGLVFGCVPACFSAPAFAQESGPDIAGEPFTSPDPAPTAPSASQPSERPPDSAGQAPTTGATGNQQQKTQKKSFLPDSFIVAPLPISSPALGTGLVPVLAYIFPFSRKDTISPPSIIGAAGLFTDNGSRGLALGAQLYFKQNTYRAAAAYFRGNLNYNVYTPGTFFESQAKLPLKQTGQAFFGEFLRRTVWNVFVGPRFITGNSILTLRAGDVDQLPIPPDLEFSTSLRSIGFRVLRDTRPNHFYPTTGTLTDFTSDFFAQGIGSKYTFQSYKLMFNKYGSLTNNQVLAFGTVFCATGGEPPFYGNCIYGAQNQLRGYTAGRYFDRYLMAAQLEYRLALPMRLGLVAFGGLGGVIPGQEQFLIRNSYFLPSGGGGLRFLLSKKYHVNLRVDLAQGKDGHTFGMGVGEAF